MTYNNYSRTLFQLSYSGMISESGGIAIVAGLFAVIVYIDFKLLPLSVSPQGSPIALPHHISTSQASEYASNTFKSLLDDLVESVLAFLLLPRKHPDAIEVCQFSKEEA